MTVTLRVNDFSVSDFVEIASEFGSDAYAYAVTPNVDHVIRYFDDPDFRELYRRAGYVLLDSRILSGLVKVSKGMKLLSCPGSDVTKELFDSVIHANDKVLLIGGTAGQAQVLRDRYGLMGLRHFNPRMGFIKDGVAVEECLRVIESESPFRFCMLAVGCPQQEILAHALHQRGRARGLALCVGASINFLTGVERRAPVWMRRMGLEWMHRLAHNPARLAKRYLVRCPRIFLLMPRINFETIPESSVRSSSAVPSLDDGISVPAESVGQL